jgi:hypothetical protein
MAPKILFVTIVSLIIGLGIFSQLAEANHQQQILNSTMMITITVPEYDHMPAVDEDFPVPPDEYRPIAKPSGYIQSEGLGTLISIDDEPMLVTHDHWSLLDESLGVVQISDAYGNKLAEIHLLKFKKLIRYRDGGTMILEAPKDLWKGQGDLSSLAGDLLGKQRSISGDTVFLVRRQNSDAASDIAVTKATIEKIGVKQGKPIIRLLNENGESIVGGDSGGGVWIQGNFIGNMWTTVMKEDISSGARRQTASSIAALYPGPSFDQGDQDNDTNSNWVASIMPKLTKGVLWN